MFRKLLLPAACLLLLGGCVTGYGYGDGGYRGGYYYGQPSVRYYGGVGYGSGYGYYPYGRYGYGYGYPYGSSIYYGHYYGGYPYYRYPYYPYPRHHRGDGHHDGDRDDHDGGRHDRKPPWRDWANRDYGPRQEAPQLRTFPRTNVATPNPVTLPSRPAYRPTERAERRETFRARAAAQPRNRSERDFRREEEP